MERGTNRSGAQLQPQCGLHGIGETIMTVSHCRLSAGLVRHVGERREWVLKRSFNKDSFFFFFEIKKKQELKMYKYRNTKKRTLLKKRKKISLPVEWISEVFFFGNERIKRCNIYR